jgi:hypothetical protein
VDPEYVGKRGERIFEVLIMDFCGRPEPFCNPIFLGEKFPTVDYYVELVGAKARPYFFVQVKSTSKGYKTIKGKKRLKAKVNQEDVDQMVAFPAPTYAVGIDERARRGYLLSVNEPRKSIATFPTRFPQTCANLQRLWDEVNTFWSGLNMVLANSYFTE